MKVCFLPRSVESNSLANRGSITHRPAPRSTSWAARNIKAPRWLRLPGPVVPSAAQRIVYTAPAADFASQFCRSEIRGAESERRAAATMLPYIHLGPLTLGTYGLMLATALLCGFFVLRADLNRRRLAANPETWEPMA